MFSRKKNVCTIFPFMSSQHIQARSQIIIIEDQSSKSTDTGSPKANCHYLDVHRYILNMQIWGEYIGHKNF